MSTTASPPTDRRVRRFARPGWRDPRLWLGLALLAGAMLAGAALLSDRSDAVVVLRATRDLGTGATPADLEPVAVPADVAQGYLRPADDATGVLAWPVAAGDLVPRRAVVAAGTEAGRAVTVPIEPLHVPGGLAPGDIVDVWSTPADLSGGSHLVLAAVPVAGVDADGSGLSGSVGVTLLVPASSVGSVVLAAHAGAVDLVAVPIQAQRAGQS